MIRIRSFAAEDVPYIAQQQLLLNEHHVSFDGFYYEPSENAGETFRSYVLGRLNDGDFCILVAEVDDRIAGYIMGWVETRPPIYKHRSVGYLSNVHVAPEFRGLGVGERLHVELEKWLAHKDVDLLEVRIDVRNATVINFNKGRGFRELSMTLYRTAVAPGLGQEEVADGT